MTAPSGGRVRFSECARPCAGISSASVPTALDEAIEQGRIKDGQLLLFAALGGGLAWASAAVKW